ncbi:uncharacterized protein [Triticum aestivum]|uniref:uncharacterized protein isoform X3 n=1 Tax=Triticum aestivum TaxID=4565 RepID=UPI001D019B38|nr:uncharacterized protein LOC123130008 isoform X3 [Triticum aestivum]
MANDPISQRNSSPPRLVGGAPPCRPAPCRACVRRASWPAPLRRGSGLIRLALPTRIVPQPLLLPPPIQSDGTRAGGARARPIRCSLVVVLWRASSRLRAAEYDRSHPRRRFHFTVRGIGGPDHGVQQGGSEPQKAASGGSSAAESGQACPSRELLEQLGAEITTEGVSRVSKTKLSEYSEKIEALAATLAASVKENENPVDEIKEESSCEREKAESPISLSAGLRRRSTRAQVEAGTSSHDRKERETGGPIKLDAEAQANIEKHRDLQDSLIDEMVDLARELKKSSLVVNQSVQDTEKILDSTERAMEHSLASTGSATARASEVYSLASKTTCFQWLLIFLMTCMFVMVVMLIRVT